MSLDSLLMQATFVCPFNIRKVKQAYGYSCPGRGGCGYISYHQLGTAFIYGCLTLTTPLHRSYSFVTTRHLSYSYSFRFSTTVLCLI
jgi:hypothetical protein